MSKRLTDEHLNALGEFENRRDRYQSVASVAEVRAMIAELSERRAADLSDEEREALAWVRELTAWTHCGRGRELQLCALAVLDRLLGGRQ